MAGLVEKICSELGMLNVWDSVRRLVAEGGWGIPRVSREFGKEVCSLCEFRSRQHKRDAS